MRLSRRFCQAALCLVVLLMACQPLSFNPSPSATAAPRRTVEKRGQPIARATTAPRPTQAGGSTTPTVNATPTARATETADATPTAAATRSADSSQDVTLPNEAEMIDAAESVRDLESSTDVPVRLMTRREFSEEYFPTIIEEDMDPDAVAAEEAILKLFGILEADDDLMETYLALYGEQVAGFYDTEENIFYLVTDAALDSLSVNDRLTFVHEYVHALQDQHFDLDAHLESETMTADEMLAYTALVEGDAQSATTTYMFTGLTPEDIGELMNEDVDTSVLDSSPPYLQESLLFPYLEGSLFVQGKFGAGWDDVNALWAAPPTSTEQILHPERYPDDQPVAVSLPEGMAEALGGGWQETMRDRMGEYMLRLLLRHGEGSTGVTSDMSAAEGWGGDEYVVLTSGDQRTLVVEWAWDDADEAAEATEALAGYLDAAGLSADGTGRYEGDSKAAYLSTDGTTTTFILTDAPDVVEPLVAALDG